MKMSNEALKIVPHENAEQTRSSLPRLTGLTPGDELDPATLIDLLGDIDGIKREIQERMRRIDAVKEAKSLLMDEAVRTETLNKRLTEMSRLMKAVDSGSFVVEDVRDAALPTDPRTQGGRGSVEGVAIAWPKFEDSSSQDPMRAATRNEAMLTNGDADADVVSAGDALVPAAVSAQVAELKELLMRCEESLAEAKKLLVDTQAGYNDASAKKEKAEAEFQAIQQELKFAYAAANQHALEAEGLHRNAAEISTMTQAKIEKAELALAEARVREELAASELQSARQELTTAYQFASVAAQRRLESAEFFERTAQWAVFGSLFSWVAMVWMGWIALISLHKNAPVLLPILGSIILVLGGMVLIKRRVRESEDR